METGCRFEITGVVQRRYDFDDRQTGSKVFGVEVAWLGGSHSFMCDDRAQQDLFPEDGEVVAISGPMFLVKGKFPRMKAIKIVAVGAEKSAASGKRS